MKKNLIKGFKAIGLTGLLFLLFTVTAYAEGPADLADAQARTLTAVQYVEGIITALALAFFGLKAKYNWSMSNVVENATDIEKHKKAFTRNIIGIIGLLVMSAIIIYVTGLYK